MNSYIRSISYYLPEKIYSNEEFFGDFPEAKAGEENMLKIGVQNRRIVAIHETASDMAVSAAEKLFATQNIDRSEIDFVLFCAQEFDYYTPTTACVIQDRLGLPTRCGALDFNLGCSGFVYGLSLAKGLIESVGQKNVLLLTSSSLTRTFHPKDKSSRFVFGDGAAATLISSREENGIGRFVFGTDGKGKDKIIVRDGGARNPVSPESHQQVTDEYGNVTSAANFYMNGTGVFLFGLQTVPKLVKQLLESENRKIGDIDLFIFHQANVFLIDAIRKKLDIPTGKVFNFMENTGNTVSSSIPIALHEAIHCGKAKKGDTVLVAGFGVGLSWAACLLKL
jgi:3-oxoacyl-[acyl-carrier-protein] synthase-3